MSKSDGYAIVTDRVLIDDLIVTKAVRGQSGILVDGDLYITGDINHVCVRYDSRSSRTPWKLRSDDLDICGWYDIRNLADREFCVCRQSYAHECWGLNALTVPIVVVDRV